MDQAYWQKLQTIFEKALELNPLQQAAFLAEACDGDTAMQEDLISLLDAHVDAVDNWSQVAAPSSPMPSFSLPYQDGDHIGHHRIIEQIGIGGMGIVYHAFDSRLERNVALKFLPAFMHSDESTRTRFLAEARTASRLDHPNICVIHDINETEEGHLYITMPHYEGETLAARLKRGSLKVDDALLVTIQTADGLAAAHAQDIVHRDIKPANIMLTREGSVKILDFGIAKVSDVHLTRTGMRIGTLSYMAPEQMLGQEVDARADIWALGITLYEMLTGETAFKGEGLSQIVNAVVDEENELLASLSDHIPQALHSILNKAMQRNRDERYTDMRSMLEECLEVQAMLNEVAEYTRRIVQCRNDSKAYDWDPVFLNGVIQILTPVMGPVASRLVHRQAGHARDLDALCAALCEQLPDTATKQLVTEKMRIRAAMNTTPPAPNTIRNSLPGTGLDLSAMQLAQLESCLLPYIGPIAGTLIRRAVTNTTERERLCTILSESVTRPDEQAAILKEIQGIIYE